MKLSTIDPAFRKLVDLLFFTDRTDIDTTNFLTLLGSNKDHYEYVWDRFLRSSEIYWEESFWLHRFDFVLNSKVKKLEEDIDNHLLSLYRRKFSYYYSPRVYDDDNIDIQYLAWIKSKATRNESLKNIKSFLLNLPYVTKSTNLAKVVGAFIPYVFKDMDEYLAELSNGSGSSARHFEVIQELEKQGLKLNKDPIFKQAKDLLFKRVPNRKNRRAFFTMINDPEVLADLKSVYKTEHNPRLVSIISICDYKEFEDFHLRNIKNVLLLDDTVADQILNTYADKLYARGYGYKRANIARLIRVCKTFPQISPKKVLVWLSKNNRMPDIKYLVKAFPDLKTLVPFV